MKNLMARCAEATGNDHAARLLMRVCWWHPRMSCKWGGHVWAAKTRRDWAVDTGLTLKKTRAALEVLRRRNLVMVETHFLGNRVTGEHRLATYIRLSEAGLVVLRGVDQMAPTGHNVMAPTGQNKTIVVSSPSSKKQLAPLSPFKKKETVPQKHLLPEMLPHHPPSPLQNFSGEGSNVVPFPGTDAVAVNCTGSDVNSLAPETQGVYTESSTTGCVEEDGVATVAEVIAGHGKKDSGPVKLTPVGLAQAWRHLVAQHHPSQYVAPPLKKELGQWGQFLKAVPEQSVSAVLRVSLEHWHSFCQHARYATGTEKSPAVPDVGYLVKHVSHAVTFVHGKLKEAAAFKQAQPLPPPPKVAPVPAKPGHVKATWEELQQILAEG